MLRNLTKMLLQGVLISDTSTSAIFLAVFGQVAWILVYPSGQLYMLGWAVPDTNALYYFSELCRK